MIYIYKTMQPPPRIVLFCVLRNMILRKRMIHIYVSATTTNSFVLCVEKHGASKKYDTYIYISATATNSFLLLVAGKEEKGPSLVCCTRSENDIYDNSD